jgi:hypothetical protein
MDLLLQLQEDITDKLNSESAFQFNAVMSLRHMVIAKEVARRLPHLTAKNGRKGCGILVGMPTLEAMLPNIAPPQGDLVLPIDIIENPEINFGPNGTQITCEQCARAVRQYLHLYAIAGAVTLYQDKDAFGPIAELEESWPRCAGYRVLLRGRLAEDPIPKLALPAITEGPPLTITLAVADGSTIYFTTDGSFPGLGNAAAQQYTQPFAVAAGATVRWASYLAGCLGSDAGQAQITS